jgi:hypothetical protein
LSSSPREKPNRNWNAARLAAYEHPSRTGLVYGSAVPARAFSDIAVSIESLIVSDTMMAAEWRLLALA